MTLQHGHGIVNVVSKVFTTDLDGFDAVVDAFGNWTLEAIDLIPAATMHMADVLSGTETRLLVVGGAGSLYVDGERTGKYLVGGEELLLNDAGESVISYADYAIAMVDEIESGEHVKQRIGVVRA